MNRQVIAQNATGCVSSTLEVAGVSMSDPSESDDRGSAPRRIRCPHCDGVGRLYEVDENGEPCMWCREDGYLFEDDDMFQAAVDYWAEQGVSPPPEVGTKGQLDNGAG